MSQPRKTFEVIDVDSRVLEPAAVWTEYLAPDYRVPARSAFWHEVGPAGVATAILNGRPAPPLARRGLPRYALWRPGLTPDAIGALDPRQPHPPAPGASDPQARLADMDAMGVDRALLFPTLFNEYFPVVENPDVARSLATAYNDWLLDFAATAPDRLLPVAVLPLQDVNFAVGELERVAGRGFRAAVLRPCYVNGRFLNHPYYNPLWRRLEELDIAACIHPAPGGTNPEGTSTGTFAERVAANLNIGHPIAEAVGPLQDNSVFLTAIAFYGHLEEYPHLRLALVGAGASWLPLALEKSETYLWLMGHTNNVSLEPADVFFGRPSLVSFDAWESAVPELPEIFAPVAAWGSRYPSHDAAGPDEAIANLARAGLAESQIAALMGGNAARLFGLAPPATAG
jgi:predicted TIM-barrel fold metal-dependent hydrolase